MNKIFLFFIILLASNILFSQEKSLSPIKKIQGSKDLPAELNLLIDCLQIDNDYSTLLPLITNIDIYARSLSKEDIFLIGKIEIYKSLLKSNATSKNATVDGDSLKTLKAAIKKTNEPFTKWFLEALLHDCESLLANPAFKDYLLQKNSGRLEKLEFKKIDKKVQLLSRWISKINPDSSSMQDSIRAELNSLMIESLKNIEDSFQLIVLSMGITPEISKNPEQLKFFSLKEMKNTKTAPRKEKSVDEILSPVTGEGKSNESSLPEPSEDNWLNEDNAPVNLKNLPKPSNDADWLQDI